MSSAPSVRSPRTLPPSRELKADPHLPTQTRLISFVLPTPPTRTAADHLHTRAERHPGSIPEQAGGEGGYRGRAAEYHGQRGRGDRRGFRGGRHSREEPQGRAKRCAGRFFLAQISKLTFPPSSAVVMGAPQLGTSPHAPPRVPQPDAHILQVPGKRTPTSPSPPSSPFPQRTKPLSRSAKPQRSRSTLRQHGGCSLTLYRSTPLKELSREGRSSGLFRMERTRRLGQR